jgi:hypothetical protein
MIHYRSCRPLGHSCAISPTRKRWISSAVRPVAARGRPSGINGISRPFREEGLAAARRRARRRAVESRGRSWLNSSGTVGGQWIFVHDRYAYGRRFRILYAGDDVTGDCLAAIPGASISGRRVARQAKHDRLRQWNHVQPGRRTTGSSGI